MKGVDTQVVQKAFSNVRIVLGMMVYHYIPKKYKIIEPAEISPIESDLNCISERYSAKCNYDC